MEVITSRQNALCTHLRKLAASGSYRRAQGEFLCEGPKLLEECLLHGGLLHTVVCTEEGDLPPLPPDVRCVRMPPEVLKSVSPTETPQGLLAICGLPEQSLPETLPGRRYVVLDGVQDPGNVGTILRTADAFGADGVVLVNACADLYNPKTVRATMGAIFRCPTWSCETGALEGALRQSALPLYGAALRADTVDARTADYRRCALAIGSEGKGLSQEVLVLCDRTIRIPMRAHCESLNAAIAAAALLWEAARGD